MNIKTYTEYMNDDYNDIYSSYGSDKYFMGYRWSQWNMAKHQLPENEARDNLRSFESRLFDLERKIADIMCQKKALELACDHEIRRAVVIDYNPTTVGKAAKSYEKTGFNDEYVIEFIHKVQNDVFPLWLDRGGKRLNQVECQSMWTQYLTDDTITSSSFTLWYFDSKTKREFGVVCPIKRNVSWSDIGRSSYVGEFRLTIPKKSDSDNTVVLCHSFDPNDVGNAIWALLEKDTYDKYYEDENKN